MSDIDSFCLNFSGWSIENGDSTLIYLKEIKAYDYDMNVSGLFFER